MDDDLEARSEQDDEERQREAFFDLIEETAKRVNMSPEEADALVEEAVRWVRSHPEEAG